MARIVSLRETKVERDGWMDNPRKTRLLCAYACHKHFSFRNMQHTKFFQIPKDHRIIHICDDRLK